MASKIASGVEISIGEKSNERESIKNLANEAVVGSSRKPPPKRRFSTQERTTTIPKITSEIMATKSKTFHKSASNLSRMNSVSFDAVAARRDSKSGIPMMDDSRFNRNMHKLGTVPSYLKTMKTNKVDMVRPGSTTSQNTLKDEDLKKKPTHKLGELPTYLAKKTKERPKSSPSQTTLKGEEIIHTETITEAPEIDSETFKINSFHLFIENKRKLLENIKQIIFTDAQAGDSAEAQQNVLTNIQKSFSEIEEQEVKNEKDFESLWKNIMENLPVDTKTNVQQDDLELLRNSEAKLRQIEGDLKHSRQMVDRLKSDTLKKDGEIRSLKKEYESLQGHTDDTIAKIKKAQLQSERHNVEYKQKLRELTEKLEQTQKQKLKIEEDVKRIKDDSSTSNTHLQDLKMEINKLSMEKKELLRKVQDLEALLSDNKVFVDQMHELSRLNQEQKSTIQFLEEEVKAQKAEFAKNLPTSPANCEECCKKDEILVKLNELIMKLRNENTELKEMVEKQKKLLEIRSELINTSQDKEDTDKRQIAELTKAVDEKKSIILQVMDFVANFYD